MAVFSRQALTDIPVLLCILLALYGLIRTLEGPETERRYALIAWVSMGLGVLTKGPVGLLPLAVWIPFLLISGNRAGLGRLNLATGIPVFVGVAAPWYGYMVWRYGLAYLDVSVMSEVVARVGATTFGGPTRGPLYYFSVWPADVVPWTPFFLASIALLALRWLSVDRSSRQLALLAGTWFVVIQVIFAISLGKQPHYILPSYPAVALFVALLFEEAPRLAGGVAPDGFPDAAEDVSRQGRVSSENVRNGTVTGPATLSLGSSVSSDPPRYGHLTVTGTVSLPT